MAETKSSHVWAIVIGACLGSVLGLIILVTGSYFLKSTSAPLPSSSSGEESPEAPPVVERTDLPKPPQQSAEPSDQDLVSAPKQVAKSTSPTVDPELVDSVEKKLRAISLAMLNFESAHRAFPSRAPQRGQKPVLLSWRVQILPFLEQQPLYDMFYHDEPWDSLHNRALLKAMPDVFRVFEGEESVTHFKVFTGDETMFPPRFPSTFASCRDGTANTLLAVYAEKAIPWTQPEDIEFDTELPKTDLGALNGLFRGVLVDGSPLVLPEGVDGDTVSALVTPRGGEVVDGHGLYRRYSSPKGEMNTDRKQITMSRLKSLALAMHRYQDAHKSFPPAWSEQVPDRESRRRPPMSWRVLLLPYLEQRNLYTKYDMTKKWDHPDNLALLDDMPSVYRHEDDVEVQMTRVQVFSNPGAVFEMDPNPKPGMIRRNPVSYRSLRDVAGQTLLFVEGGPEMATPWTKPSAIELELENPLAQLGTLDPQGFGAAMVDGSIQWLTPEIEPAVFRSMVLLNDGE
jgi:hypothetical protein